MHISTKSLYSGLIILIVFAFSILVYAQGSQSHTTLEILQPFTSLEISTTVGIGTSPPTGQTALHVAGGTKIDGSLDIAGKTIKRITKCTFHNANHQKTPGPHVTDWIASNCDNGLPSGNCFSSLTKAVANGRDEDFAIFNPGEQHWNSHVYPNGGFSFYVPNTLAGLTWVEGVYFCD
ncbi:MAG: hypothetical protein QF632_02810, partial [Candidatus Woesearchaeota archaeon]|nr:hypothetical protein [Candidatus Woesearchaeota archaeon]